MIKCVTKGCFYSSIWVFILMVAVLAIGSLGTAQADLIKYGYTTPGGSSYPSISPDYLLGFAISTSDVLVLTHVGIIDMNTNNVYGKVGIYSNSGGAPGTLLAQTDPFHLTGLGDNLIPLAAQVTLDAGTYWFMPVYDSPGAFLYGPGQFTVPTKYLSFNYDNPLPTTFPAHSSYNGYPACYYLAGTAIPEPATMSLLAVGGLALLLRKRSA